MKSLLRTGSLAFAALSMVILMSSCGEKGDTIARVKVVKASDGTTPVVGATVRLFADDQGDPELIRDGIEKEGTTNGQGEALFNYNDLFKNGQAGLFVLQAEITKDIYMSEGIVKVEEHETSEATIEINVP